MTYSQIWLNPLVDDRQSTYLVPNSQNLKCFEKKNPLSWTNGKKKKERKKEKHNPHFSSSSSSSSSVPTSVLCSSVSFFVLGRLLLPLPPVSLLSVCLSVSLLHARQPGSGSRSITERVGGRERERERESFISVSLLCLFKLQIHFHTVFEIQG